MNSKEQKIAQFDPNSIGVHSSNVFGLPFTFEESDVIILPVPWDLTTSFGRGTANAPARVMEASYQVDLYDQDYPSGWKHGFFMLDIPEQLKETNKKLNAKSREVIRLLEAGESDTSNAVIHKSLELVNDACEQMREWVFKQAQKLLQYNKKVVLLGGEHSTPLGLIQALSLKKPGFGILQIDAHADLREAYEGFTYSHASIMHHALKQEGVKKIVQVGIRDICQEEIDAIEASNGRVEVFYDRYLKDSMMEGRNFASLAEEIIDCLPQEVYVSFDVDGLEPGLCPNTGTPVPGGLSYEQAEFILRKVVDSGRQIIGADINEVGDNPWDANVGARLLYKLCNLQCLSFEEEA